MFESPRTPEDRSSVLEERLHGWAEDRGPLRVELFSPRSVFIFDDRTHAALAGRVEPAAREFAGLLEGGAGHLGRARAAHRVQCRAAATQARELAAFAAARPAAVLDRPDAEVGAAAVASRAARPAVLTAVSEWAVDEVTCALGLSSDAAARLLTESLALVEKLPATLGALEAGIISWA